MAKRKSSSKSEPLTLLIVSGGTGRTVEHVVNSALAQFEDPNVRLVKKPGVNTAGAAEKVATEAADREAIICHSLVDTDVRNALLDASKHRLVPIVDVMGGVLAVLTDHLGSQPRREPGLSYKIQREYFDRMEAINFTLEHDDGAGLHTLDKADVVLVGVSRVGKSVTCFYLGYRGIRTANVPLVPGFDPPSELLQLPQEKVIALTVNLNRLQAIREARHEMLGGKVDYYIDRRKIGEELRDTMRLAQKHGWRTLDVSYMAIEEVARTVLTMIGR